MSENAKAMAHRGKQGYRANMYEAYPGKLALADGRLVSAVFTLAEDVLTISAEGITVGTWPLKYCRLAPDADGAFRVVVDGEPTVFRPSDPVEFAKVAAQRFQASPLSDRINLMRRMPPAVDVGEGRDEAETGGRFFDVPRLPLIGGVTLIMILVLVVLSGINRSTDESVKAAEAPATETTVAPPPAVGDQPAVFMLTAAAFADSWNEAAMRTDVTPLIRPVQPDPGVGQLEFEVAVGTNLVVTLGTDGTVESYRVTAVLEEIGETEATRDRAIVALGVAIGVAEPGTEPDTWVLRLMQLGLQQELQVQDLDMTLDRDGVSYHLWYVGLSDLLQLTVEPA